MGLKLQTAADAEPVSVSDAKSHMRVDIDDDDTLIGNYIKAATELVQNETKRQFISATYDYTLNTFPLDDYIEVPRSPLQSVTSIGYTDAAGDAQTFSSDNYTADTYHTPGRIVLNYNENWPTCREDYNSVAVRFICGYGDDSSAVPEAVRHAILLIVAHWYEHRESVSELSLKEVPMAVHSLLDTVRIREAR